MLKVVLLAFLTLAVTASTIPPAYEAVLDRYVAAKNQYSDINEHIPTLYQYAKASDSVIECGVRGAVSTWAFIRGLLDRSIHDGHDLKTLSLVGIDLEDHIRILDVQQLTKAAGLPYTFYKGSDLDYPLDQQVDTVFIDTWHVYGQLIRELRRYAPYVKKWFILHDTTVDAIYGESLRQSWNIDKQVADSGWPRSDVARGLWPAVEDFLAENKDFVIERRYVNNNGLTILRRVGASATVEGHIEL